MSAEITVLRAPSSVFKSKALFPAPPAGECIFQRRSRAEKRSALRRMHKPRFAATGCALANALKSPSVATSYLAIDNNVLFRQGLASAGLQSRKIYNLDNIVTD